MSEKITAPDPKSEEKKLDVEKILEDYSYEQLKIFVAQSHLIGNFDKNNEYSILEIIYPELINLDKIIEKKSVQEYEVFSIISEERLNFVVEFKPLLNNQISATLVLKEKLMLGQLGEREIATPLKTIEGHDDLNFLFKVKKVFHLHTPDEIDEQSLFENYVSPPIELVTELKRKRELCEALMGLTEDEEKDYINEIMNKLKKSAEGAIIVKKFLKTIQTPKVIDKKDKKVKTYKEVLDQLIDEAIKNNELPEKEKEQIAEVRQKFVEVIKSTIVEYKKNQEIDFAPKKQKAPKVEEKKEEKVEKKPEVKKEEKTAEPKSAPAPSSTPTPSPKKENKEESKEPITQRIIFALETKLKDKIPLNVKERMLAEEVKKRYAQKLAEQKSKEIPLEQTSQREIDLEGATLAQAKEKANTTKTKQQEDGRNL